jgi:hypothetical protein
MSLSFELPTLFDETFEDAAHSVFAQRAFVVANDVVDDLFFPDGIENSQSSLTLDASDFKHAPRALAQQIQDLLVDSVDSGSPVFDGLL